MVAHRPDWTHLAPARVGRADRRVLLRRAARRLLLERAHRRARRAHLPRRPRRRRVVRAPRGGAAAAGHALRAVRRRASSARRPTSSTCGSTPAAATRRCWRRGRSCAGRRSCTSRAPTSIAAGSTRRCWRRSARAARRRTSSVLTHGFVVDGEGRKMSKSGGNAVTPGRVDRRSTAPRCCGCGWPPRTTRRTSASPREILDRLADAYRRIRNTYRFLLGNLARLRSRARPPAVRAARRGRPLDPRPARAADRPRDARLRGVPVPHGLPRRAQLLRGGPVGAVPRHHQGPPLHVARPTTRGAAPRRPRAHDIFGALLAPDGADPHVHGRGGVASRCPARTARACTSSASPRCRSSGSTTRLEREWDRLLEVRREVAKALETARARRSCIGSGLEAAVRIAERAGGPARRSSRRKRDLLPTLFIVSRVELERGPPPARCVYESQEIPGLVIAVDRARGPEVRALLDVERARRRGRAASGALRALRVIRSIASARRDASADRCMTSSPSGAVVVVLDQVTKAVVLAHLAPGIARRRGRRLRSRSRSS